MYVSRLLRRVFSAAKNAQPAVIHIDDAEVVLADRSGRSVQKTHPDYINTLLKELNDIGGDNIICIGTARNLNAVDTAVVKSLRLEPLKMGVPNVKAREEIFRYHLQLLPTEYVDWDGIEVGELAWQTKGFTGADIATSIKTASQTMAIEYQNGRREQPLITQGDLVTVIQGSEVGDA